MTSHGFPVEYQQRFGILLNLFVRRSFAWLRGVDGSVVVFSTWIAIKDVRSSGASCMYLRTAELPHLPSSMIVTVSMPALASI